MSSRNELHEFISFDLGLNIDEISIIPVIDSCIRVSVLKIKRIDDQRAGQFESIPDP